MRCFPLSIKANVYTKSITNDNFMKLGLTKAKNKKDENGRRQRSRRRRRRRRWDQEFFRMVILGRDVNLWIGIEGSFRKQRKKLKLMIHRSLEVSFLPFRQKFLSRDVGDVAFNLWFLIHKCFLKTFSLFSFLLVVSFDSTQMWIYLWG